MFFLFYFTNPIYFFFLYGFKKTFFWGGSYRRRPSTKMPHNVAHRHTDEHCNFETAKWVNTVKREDKKKRGKTRHLKGREETRREVFF